MPLRKLIFVEDHLDPATTKIITKLLPELKELKSLENPLGYECFFAEQPPGSIESEDGTLEEAIQKKLVSFNRIRKTASTLVSTLDHEKEDIKIEHSEKLEIETEFLLLSLRNELLKLDLVSDDWKIPVIKYLILMLPRISASILFLQAVIQYKITYQQIDDPIIDSLIGQSPDRTKELLDKIRPLRDKTMSAAYLSAKQPVFGVVGLHHLEGMQNEFIKALTHEKAQNDFRFFYIYSKRPDVLDNLECLAQEDKLKLPLNLNVIDATKKSDNDILEMIINLAMNKNDLYEPESQLVPSKISIFSHHFLNCKLLPKKLEIANNVDKKRNRCILL